MNKMLAQNEKNVNRLKQNNDLFSLGSIISFYALKIGLQWEINK